MAWALDKVSSQSRLKTGVGFETLLGQPAIDSYTHGHKQTHTHARTYTSHTVVVIVKINSQLSARSAVDVKERSPISMMPSRRSEV